MKCLKYSNPKNSGILKWAQKQVPQTCHSAAKGPGLQLAPPHL